MAAVATRPTGPDDNLDNAPDLYDDLEELFAPIQASVDNTETQRNRGPSPKRSRPIDDDLGLNEEVQVVKKRKPIAKLDDERLLSQAGIPKLRRLVGSKLKFKGKGHEFSDISRMLNLYQLWLDDLYPRAKFADGLAIIEKLGHSKRMNVMRKEWIKEGVEKTKAIADERETQNEGGRPISNDENGDNAGPEEEEESLFVGGLQPDLDLPEDADTPIDDDELDDLLAEIPNLPAKPVAKTTIGDVEDDRPPEDGFEDQYSEEMRMMADMENW